MNLTHHPKPEPRKKYWLPFSLSGTVRRAWVFVYRTRPEAAADLLPPRFEPETAGGQAFLNVEVAEVERLRPRGLPGATGLTFRQVFYRLYAKTRLDRGRQLEGMYVLRGDCDAPLVRRAGNLLTPFRFNPCEVDLDSNECRTEIEIISPGGEASARIDYIRRPELSWQSPFDSLTRAKQFLQFRPRTLSAGRNGEVASIGVLRRDPRWTARLVTVTFARWRFLEDLPIEPELCLEYEPLQLDWLRTHHFY